MYVLNISVPFEHLKGQLSLYKNTTCSLSLPQDCLHIQIKYLSLCKLCCQTTHYPECSREVKYSIFAEYKLQAEMLCQGPGTWNGWWWTINPWWGSYPYSSWPQMWLATLPMAGTTSHNEVSQTALNCMGQKLNSVCVCHVLLVALFWLRGLGKCTCKGASQQRWSTLIVAAEVVLNGVPVQHPDSFSMVRSHFATPLWAHSSYSKLSGAQSFILINNWLHNIH